MEYKKIVENSQTIETKLKDICNFQEGYVNPSQSHIEYFDGPVKWLRAVDINESCIINTSRTLTNEGYASAGKSAVLFKPFTIAISKSGTIGRLGIVADYMCGNRAVINISVNNQDYLPYVYMYLKNKQKELPNLAVGSVQKNLYVSIIEDLSIPLPLHEELTAFCELGNSIIADIVNRTKETNALKDMRDTLLPKLMSGELDVSNLDI